MKIQGGIVLLGIVWLGLIYLCRRWRKIQIALFAMTLIGLGFLAAPARKLPSSQTLQRDYVIALMRYDGARYVWGGENYLGIDCSGLARRALVDSLALRSIKSANPELLRRALSLWWHDCTAETLGEAPAGLTEFIIDTPELNRLDPYRICAGDLAVTKGGAHVMVYLGNNEWIEADPGVRLVITVSTPNSQNPWCRTPMRIVRWSVLQG